MVAAFTPPMSENIPQIPVKERRHYTLMSLSKAAIVEFYGLPIKRIRKFIYPKYFQWLLEAGLIDKTIEDLKDEKVYEGALKEWMQKKRTFKRREIYLIIEKEQFYDWEIERLEQCELKIRATRKGAIM